MLIKTLTKFTLIITLCIGTPAMAAFGKIISQTDAVEAEKVDIRWDKKKGTGFASVTGCKNCPLQFKIDQQVKFFHNGQAVQINDLNTYSGKPGTVIYDAAKKQAIKIIW